MPLPRPQTLSTSPVAPLFAPPPAPPIERGREESDAGRRGDNSAAVIDDGLVILETLLTLSATAFMISVLRLDREDSRR